MKSRHRLWHGRLWIALSILIITVLTMAIIFRPKIISQNSKTISQTFTKLVKEKNN